MTAVTKNQASTSLYGFELVLRRSSGPLKVDPFFEFTISRVNCASMYETSDLISAHLFEKVPSFGQVELVLDEWISKGCQDDLSFL